MVSEIQEALPDSVSAWEMYVRLQPLVVRIGDGTHLCIVIINTREGLRFKGASGEPALAF